MANSTVQRDKTEISKNTIVQRDKTEVSKELSPVVVIIIMNEINENTEYT